MVAGPTVPPPPALLSIVIGWPMNFEALSAIARIAMSVDPPAGHGTIRVIGLVGYSCAPAPAPTSAPSCRQHNRQTDCAEASSILSLAARIRCETAFVVFA